MTSTPAIRAALNDLGRHWGQFYDLAHRAGQWIAQRLDNGHMLTAATPDTLHRLIAADQAAQPVQPAATCGQHSR